MDVSTAILAKTAEITSIKVLDNINDLWQSQDRALKSLEIQHKAFTTPNFQMPDGEDLLSLAENATYKMAELTGKIVLEAVDKDSITYKMYTEDFERYIRGQSSSMGQRIDADDEKVDIRKFLLEVNEKGVGRVWIDVDFCLLEGCLDLEYGEVKAMELIREAIDLIFKGCNIYDDVADFHTDLSEGILNSVAYLAIDQGYCSELELKQHREVIYKLMEMKAFEDAIQLGDLIFLKGLAKLDEAKTYTNLIDVDGLRFNAEVLRIFAMRKWLINGRNVKRWIDVMKPKVSEKIADYEKYIK